MIVTPTPTNPRSPARRALRVAGIMAPVVLLVTAVGIGLLGPRPLQTEPPQVPAVVPEEPAPTREVAVLPSPTDAPSPPSATVAGGTPAVFEGVSVSTVAYPRPGGIRASADELVAVVGRWWSDDPLDPLDPACLEAQDDPLGPWCERQAWLSTDLTFSGVEPPRLALRVPVGVRMPAVPAGAAVERRPLVLVLGHWLPEADACADRDPGCVDELVVERFGWADGVRVGLTPLVDPRLQTQARPNPLASMDDGLVPLLAVLTWPEDLPAVEVAAGAAAREAPEGDPVWYVRLASTGVVGPPAILWGVLTEHDLRVLGMGARVDAIAGRPIGGHW